jgi:hypothetical protein
MGNAGKKICAVQPAGLGEFDGCAFGLACEGITEARAWLERLLEFEPGLTIAKIKASPAYSPEHQSMRIEGFRKAVAGGVTIPSPTGGPAFFAAAAGGHDCLGVSDERLTRKYSLGLDRGVDQARVVGSWSQLLCCMTCGESDATPMLGVRVASHKEMVMPADTTGKAVQLLNLMLDFFADDDHWTRGRYHDPHGCHCLVGAVLYFSAKHGLPRAPVMSLLKPALPRRQIGLIAFNDRLCRSAAELRSVILKALAVALENAEHERVAAAFEDRLLAELDRDRAVCRVAGHDAAELSVSAQRLAA